MVDIKPALQKIGASPTMLKQEPDGIYTVPVLVDTSQPGPPKVISDNPAIAEYLDDAYTEYPIFPEGTKALLTLFYTHFQQKIIPPLIPLMIPRTLPFLAERDHAYFRETRERWLGTKIEDLCPTNAKREEQLQKLKEELDFLNMLLCKNGEGNDLVLGEQVSRGDFILVALFAWLAELDLDGWGRVMTWNEGRWERLWRRTEEWRLNKL